MAQPHPNTPNRPQIVENHSAAKPMSMRDFITRVMNTPCVAVEATPRIVTPHIVVEPPLDLSPACEESSSKASAPFHWDIESRSAAVLGSGKHAVGTRAYAEHPTTEVLCVSYARGNGPVETWVPGQPIPEEVLTAATDENCSWIAHNAAFERAMLEHILIPRYGWPIVPVDRHVCTMSLALAHSYPGSLEAVAKILKLKNQKDAAREKVVRVMWKPRKPRQNEDPTKLYWVDTPELRAELAVYNRQDVAVERELRQRLTALPASEQDTWVLDAEINDHGVFIDAPLATAASTLAAQAHCELNERMRHETNGAVDTATKNEKLKEWLKLQGVELPRKQRKGKSGLAWKDSLDADDIEKLLAGDLPNAQVRAALQIRLQAAQSAASKIDRMLKTRSPDGRVRGLFRFHGATTGRWSGAGFQPQNLKKPELLKTDEAIAEAIEIVMAGDYAALKVHYGDVLGVIGDLSRSMIIPAPGHRFIVGDLNAIEARVLAWLAGDTGKLERFRQYDLGLGPEVYRVTAEQVLGITDVPEKSPERALGKVFELALGYGMGAEKLLATIRRADIPNTEWITVAETTRWVRKWRLRNPHIVPYWARLNATALAAVRNPGTVFPCRGVGFEMSGGVLALRLPSGRELSYPAPTIQPGRYGRNQLAFTDTEAGRRRGRDMHGGKWAENVTSAVARDVLVEGMKRLHTAGYRLVMHAHDEVCAEMVIERGSAEEFERLLVGVPAWAQGLPIAAKIFECERFKKD
jgi:DNA polymerase bacteriophage-type